MNNNRLNICQVSLSGNISIIIENINQFYKHYNNCKFYIICPRREKKYFLKKINDKNFEIIEEEKLISIQKFKKIANSFLIKTNYYNAIQPRLAWYYQQALKISFVINFVKRNNKPIIIWDADTILLKKINFFREKISEKYGNTSEFHKAYYITNKKILKKLPNYYISCLSQFIAVTPREIDYLIKKLNKCIRKKKSTAKWISSIMMNSISKSHHSYNGSMFSEYELIGQSNLLYSYNNQKLISGVREHLNGRLTYLQLFIVKILGYSYVAYEHSHENSNSKNMLKRNQKWVSFILLLVRKTSNKFFRGIKHLIISYFKN